MSEESDNPARPGSEQPPGRHSPLSLEVCLEQLARAHQEIEFQQEATRAAQEELQYFVYAAGHDLQQPLRAIGAYAQLLQRQYGTEEQAKDFTGVIIEAASQMNTLIRDLLTYSRSGNTAHLVPVNLNAALQWAQFNLAKLIGESGAQITASDLPEVVADEKQMVTVFENLIGNAVKYRGSQSPMITIDSKSDSDSTVISVRDNAVGIKPEYQGKVFEPFKRLHNKDIPGSGLGLSLCRKILRAHKGEIWIESDGEHGSAVRFSLPH